MRLGLNELDNKANDLEDWLRENKPKSRVVKQIQGTGRNDSPVVEDRGYSTAETDEIFRTLDKAHRHLTAHFDAHKANDPDLAASHLNEASTHAVAATRLIDAAAKPTGTISRNADVGGTSLPLVASTKDLEDRKSSLQDSLEGTFGHIALDYTKKFSAPENVYDVNDPKWTDFFPNSGENVADELKKGELTGRNLAQHSVVESPKKIEALRKRGIYPLDRDAAKLDSLQTKADIADNQLYRQTARPYGAVSVSALEQTKKNRQSNADYWAQVDSSKSLINPATGKPRLGYENAYNRSVNAALGNFEHYESLHGSGPSLPRNDEEEETFDPETYSAQLESHKQTLRNHLLKNDKDTVERLGPYGMEHALSIHLGNPEATTSEEPESENVLDAYSAPKQDFYNEIPEEKSYDPNDFFKEASDRVSGIFNDRRNR
jgi:hypothetical protein